MKFPAYRVCETHRDDIVSGPDTGAGREIIMCRQGHECTRWLVIDSAGEIIATGSVHPPKNRGTKEKKNVGSSRGNNRSRSRQQHPGRA